MTNNILILGDSSSMTLGIDRQTYPYHLANNKTWRKHTQLINVSQPGFTAAGICAAYFRIKPKLKNLTGAIIYIGNNDGVTSEVLQGKYTPVKQLSHTLKNMLLKKSSSSLKFHNTLTPFTWNNYYDFYKEREEKPQDFYYNLKRIVGDCIRSQVAVFVIAPFANAYFPAGLGKGNFIFYRHLTMQEKLAGKLTIDDKRFVHAKYLQEQAKYKTAMDSYKQIMLKPKTGISPEYLLTAANNYAVAAAKLKKYDEARVVFEVLLKEPGVRKEIVLYNLAVLHKLDGDQRYNQIMGMAYEEDKTIFRVKSSFITKLKQLKVAFPEVTLIDMGNVVTDNEFIDYCHVLPEGHRKLSDRIVQKLPQKLKGRAHTSIKNIMYNPELALGDARPFYEYLGLDANLTDREIAKIINKLKHTLEEDRAKMKTAIEQIPQSIKSALDYYLKSPLFTSYVQLFRYGPRFSFDIGRFPELFLLRHVYPYIKFIEKNSKLNDKFISSHKLLKSSADLLTLFPKHTQGMVVNQTFDINPELDKSRARDLIAEVSLQLKTHLSEGNQIYERLKTTVYWYFREALYFGFHSRISMRYDRLLLEQLTQTLAVAAVLDYELKLKQDKKIGGLLHLLKITVNIHEKYGARFSLVDNNDKLLEEYDRELLKLIKQVED